MDEIKLFVKNEKRIENSNTRCQNIQPGHRDGIWHRKMRHANNEKQKSIHDGRNGTSKSRQKQNTQRKGNQ